MDYYISIKLDNNDVTSVITVKKSINEEDSKILFKIIEKISTDDADHTKSVANFLNDQIIDMMVKLNYKITYAELIITDRILLKFYEQRGPKGVNFTIIKKEFYYVNYNMIASSNFQLNLKGLIIPTMWVQGDSQRGYVLKKYYKQNQELMDEFKLNKLASNESINQEINNKSIDQENNSNEIPKNQIKLLRKSIIKKATKSDINITGFTIQFIDSLDDSEKSYIKTLSELKIKIMRSEIMKKK